MLLCFLLVGFLHRSDAGNHKVSAQTGATVTLPCPHTTVNVSWSRYLNGQKVTLVVILNGQERNKMNRFGSTASNSLVIVNVRSADAGMYFCNEKQVYLEVNAEPHTVVHGALPAGTTKDTAGTNDGFGSEGGLSNQPLSDIWKVVVGVVTGVVLVTLAVITLRFCSKKRPERNSDMDPSLREPVYEEIKDGGQQQRRKCDVGSPYYRTSATETLSATPTGDNMYATVNKPRTEGQQNDECVYSLAQHPSPTTEA